MAKRKRVIPVPKQLLDSPVPERFTYIDPDSGKVLHGLTIPLDDKKHKKLVIDGIELELEWAEDGVARFSVASADGSAPPWIEQCLDGSGNKQFHDHDGGIYSSTLPLITESDLNATFKLAWLRNELSEIEVQQGDRNPDALSDSARKELEALHAIRLRMADVTGRRDITLVRLAYFLGRLNERLHVRRYEHLAKSAEEHRRRAISNGKQHTLLTSDQQKAAAREIADLVAAGIEEQPACKQLVEKYGVSFQTLRRYYRQNQPIG